MSVQLHQSAPSPITGQMHQVHIYVIGSGDRRAVNLGAGCSFAELTADGARVVARVLLQAADELDQILADELLDLLLAEGGEQPAGGGR